MTLHAEAHVVAAKGPHYLIESIYVEFSASPDIDDTNLKGALWLFKQWLN